LGRTLYKVVVLKFALVDNICYFSSKIHGLVANSAEILRFLHTDEALIELRSDGIIKVTFNENITIDIPEQNRLTANYLLIGNGAKFPFLFDAKDNVVFTKEARENSIRNENDFPSIATAVIVKSLSYRIVANFYMKVNKPKIPFKSFKNEEEAVKWLLEIKSKFYN
jgi:hypothetical protein